MPENIKYQFNASTFKNPIFNIGGHQTPSIITAPTASVPASFLGRTQELDDIRGLLCGKSTLALVNAEGGMGKTTLAAAYWDKYRGDYKHLAWLFCEKGILQAIRSQFPERLGLKELMTHHADDAVQQIAIIKDYLANLPKDCLLVLDNANEPEHIHGFMEHMSGLGWHVLLTSRCAKVVDRQNEYAITSLPPDLARQLFTDNFTEETPGFDALLDRFLAAVGYNTLCIEIFSKNLREANPWGYDFGEFLGQLEKGGLFLGENSFAITTDYARNVRKDTRSSDKILGALYPLASLDEKDTELLIRFALLPAESHSAALLAELLPADSKPALKHHMDSLAQRGWLATDTVSYRISPVVQKIVLQKHADRRWELAEPMVKKLNEILKYKGIHSSNIATAGPFAALVFDFVENIATANDNLIQLFDGLWVFHTATGDLAKALDSAERMRVISGKHGNKEGLAISYSKLGETQAALGNLDKGIKFYEEFNRLEKELYADYPTNISFKYDLAISYSKLGDTQFALGNLDKGLTFYKEFNRLEKELYADYPTNMSFKNGLAISYSKLGDTQTLLGELEKALTYYKDEMGLFEELFTDFQTDISFKNDLAISYSKLGDTQSALGNLDEGLTFYKEFNRLEKELYAANPTIVKFKNGLAISYLKLGETQVALGNLKDALIYYEDYNRLEKELYAAYRMNVEFKNNLANSYSKLGETQSALGNLEKALNHFKDGTALFEELYDAYPTIVKFKSGLAISYEKLGGVQTALGNLQQALTYYEDFNRLEKELYDAYPTNVSIKNNLAISYEKLGDTQTALRNLDRGLTFYEEFNRLEKELYADYLTNVSFKNNLAISYSKLGNAQSALKNLDKALIYYKDEMTLLEELYAANPKNVIFKNNLAISYEKLGSTQASLGNLDKALAYYEDKTALFEELYAAYPTNVSFKNGLAISYYKLGAFGRDYRNDKAAARRYFQQAEALWLELVRDAPMYAEFQRNVGIVRRELDALS